MVSSVFPLFTLFLFLGPRLCSARDNMTFNTPIRDHVGDTLVSAGERFELGFFTPNGSNDAKRYVGIWYYGYKPQTVVWVANRENPLPDSTGVLSIAENGSPQVLDAINNKSYWSTDIYSPPPSSSFNWTLKLMDSGNLVLSQEVENQGSEIRWQSFHHPTDTFLPGMKIDENFELTSWKSSVDPKPGDFKFLLDQKRKNQYIITKNGSQPYWKSGVSGSFIQSDDTPWFVPYLLHNFSRKPVGGKDSVNITTPVPIDYNYTRLVMDSSGQIQFFVWQNESSSWASRWLEPSDGCQLFNACGTFGSCNSHNKKFCKCLQGFQPKSPDNWNSGIFAEGCTRSPTLCNGDVNWDFLELKMMKAGKPDKEFETLDEYDCMNECLRNCSCQAYSYRKAEKVDDVTCWIWFKDLNNIQEEFYTGRDLNVRVPLSAIESRKRICKSCGTNIIPYPLSTGPNCGDQMYFNFSCQDSSGQLSFEVAGGNFRVTGIDEKSHSFSIQVVDADGCTSIESMRKYLNLSQSLPYNVSRGCDPGHTLFDDTRSIEVEIAWNSPPEPLCNSPEDCNDLLLSTCSVAGDRMRRCLCSKSFQWNPEKVNCVQASTKRGKSLYPFLLGVIATAMIILCAAFYLFYSRRARRVNSRENRESIQGNVAHHFYDSERRVRDLMYSDQFREEDKKGIDVPFFDMELILAATDNFSDANKLGQGGFGPVYKGKFPGGQEIAIKRLSCGSLQGLEEFKTEVVLIAKLQHRNLVRLLGYCIEGQEKILLYEYMPNKSLDSFIFDRTRCVLLDWELRFNIIVGIARGLLYLHHDSRLKIIHRDLKTSNVLLDEEMNPKISDFGLARIFGSKQAEASTQKVVGTYGYMSPEYALDGVFSTKSDVFSFGVVVLEILSGRRNTAFYKSDQAFSLLGHTWRLWKEEKELDLMDQALCETCNANEFVRCVNVGLLCVQEDPWDRPTMSNVVFMLGSETASLPTPKQPAFVVRRSLSSTASSSSKPDSSVQLTNSLEQGR